MVKSWSLQPWIVPSLSVCCSQSTKGHDDFLIYRSIGVLKLETSTARKINIGIERFFDIERFVSKEMKTIKKTN